MKYWILAASLILSACTHKKEMLTEKEFAEEYLLVLKKDNPGVIYSLSPDLGITAKYKGKDYRHFPDNAYREYTLEPDSIEQVLKKFSQTAHELYQESEAVDVNYIIPVIKPTSFLNDIGQLGEASDSIKPTVVYQQYNDKLLIVFAEDKEHGIHYFTQENFQKLNISQDSAQGIALTNLERKLPNIKKTGDNGRYMVTAGGDYEASLILLNFIWSQNNFEVKGDIVVAIPNRDMLLVTGSKDKANLKWLKAEAQQSYDSGSYQVSPSLFRWNGKKFLKFE
ncbi:DUF1444 family protein [Hymenobacter sp. BT683]|uniref:DUF1444 family protein n=1 Tax=Hymenobacter jeongseonensis TaxID=2791027 RepID=A0ABS0IKC5_9BACT|nr:DUF1444 family protein [Hymenobacter jeongseonensis]MBF9238829.1 DUF1444 family protein [Hymenobacter jeongseonensis]